MFVCLPCWRPGDARPGFDESFVVALDFAGNHSVQGRAPTMEKTAGVRTIWRSPVCVFSNSICSSFFRQTSCGSLSGKGSQCSCALARDAKDSPTFCWRCFSREPRVTPLQRLRKETSRLGRQSCRSDNNNRFIATNLTFHRGRSVVNAHILKFSRPSASGGGNRRPLQSKQVFARRMAEQPSVLEADAVIRRRHCN